MAIASEPVPRHIAIVMDGNGRWASKRFLPRIAGHKQGVEILKRTVRSCAKRGVEVLTVFAFSSENWKRPADEVSGLMDILVGALSRELNQLKKEGVHLQFIGAREGLSERVQKSLLEAERETATNHTLTLNVCFNYGGRWDVVQAAQALAAAGETITEESLSRNLSTFATGDPDLVVRTGGEMRLSNFLLWQAAYSELYFSDVLWPDFDEAALDNAIQAYVSRERRFGMTSEQLPGYSNPRA
jgi:undecaprenyl diphosphate synthase